MLSYQWRAGDATHELRLVRVPGTAGEPYVFGAGSRQRPIAIRNFHIMATPVTQALWQHIMGSNPARRPDLRCPVENVSWYDVTGPGGFLDRINASAALAAVSGAGPQARFRLPSETEWEYAARGGPHWRDGFRFSGSNDAAAVAWYGRRWSGVHELMVRLFGGRRGWRLANRLRFGIPRPTRTHEVATKAPNQLGIYDMSGNVWEWCQDACTDDLMALPEDGSAWPGPSPERRLRGGCHHNWDLHCTVYWRYGIEPDAHDGCIGLRLALS